MWLPTCPAADCPRLPGYDLYPNLVSNSSTYASLLAANVTQLAQQCSTDPQCLGFTTWGDLKDGLMNYSDWSFIDPDVVLGGLRVLLTCDGIYVKVPPPPPSLGLPGLLPDSLNANMTLTLSSLIMGTSLAGVPQSNLLTWQVPANWTTKGSKVEIVVQLTNVFFLSSFLSAQVSVFVVAGLPPLASTWALPKLELNTSGADMAANGSLTATWLDLGVVPNQTLVIQAGQASRLLSYSSLVGFRGLGFLLFKILYILVGGAKKYQKFPESYADILTFLPEFSVLFWSTQLASAYV